MKVAQKVIKLKNDKSQESISFWLNIVRNLIPPWRKWLILGISLHNLFLYLPNNPLPNAESWNGFDKFFSRWTLYWPGSIFEMFRPGGCENHTPYQIVSFRPRYKFYCSILLEIWFQETFIFIIYLKNQFLTPFWPS